MAAYLSANMARFPDERRALAVLAFKLLGIYSPRRLAQAWLGGPIPAALIVSEVRGALSGRGRYARSVARCRQLAQEFGRPVFTLPELPRPASGATMSCATRCSACLVAVKVGGRGSRLMEPSSPARAVCYRPRRSASQRACRARSAR